MRGLGIENRLPGASGVLCLPHPAVDGADVEHVLLGGHPGYRAGAPAAEGPDHAPGEIAVQARWLLLGGAGTGEQRQGNEAERRHEQ